MPRSGCSALHGEYQLKKKEREREGGEVREWSGERGDERRERQEREERGEKGERGQRYFHKISQRSTALNTYLTTNNNFNPPSLLPPYTHKKITFMSNGNRNRYGISRKFDKNIVLTLVVSIRNNEENQHIFLIYTLLFFGASKRWYHKEVQKQKFVIFYLI